MDWPTACVIITALFVAVPVTMILVIYLEGRP